MGIEFGLDIIMISQLAKGSVEILFITRVAQLSLYTRGPNDRVMAEPHEH